MRPFKYHPRRDAFENISTKEQSYWLGLLFADGCILTEKRSGKMRVYIGLSAKDEALIDKFIDFMQLNESIKEYNTVGQVRVRINDDKIAKDLVRHGCVPRKSKIIELPALDSRELYLAFLLGFYDGDGTQHKTSITCGSLRFLEQIKEMFGLPFKIQEKHSDGFIEGRAINGAGYEMCLGASLFNEIMDNYVDSLSRKRKHFHMNDERIRQIKQTAWKGHHKKKFNITREELEHLVWEIPSIEIAKNYGVSGRLITKRCKQLGIEKPGRGYWVNLKFVEKYNNVHGRT